MIVKVRRLTLLLATVMAFASIHTAWTAQWPQYESNPFVIEFDIPVPDSGIGGIIATDLDGDTRPDFLVSRPGYLAANGNDGRKMWVRQIDIRVVGQSENNGLPGWDGPGVQAADIDGDGKVEVVFLTLDGKLQILDGRSGATENTIEPRLIDGIDKWEHVIVANLRGLGDRDLIFQASPLTGIDSQKGKMRGRMMAAFAAEAPAGAPLWQTDSYWGPAHGTARIADLDGDGLDDVAGGTLIDENGENAAGWNYDESSGLLRDGRWHFDSIFMYDVRPDLPGLEVVLLEENTEHVSLVNTGTFIWRNHHKLQEPQNAAVGEFDLDRPGLEIWCRTRYNEHQKPFVFDAHGQLIASYEMDDMAPEGWTVRGVEAIWTSDWTGEKKQLAAAKERHTHGDVAIFDPLSGGFIQRFREKADKLYVADVSGDWREELLVVNGAEIHIYHNDDPNPDPDHPRLWEQNHYRRNKMTWNYYSP